MKAIDIYNTLTTAGHTQWEILDIIETEYHNQNFNSELLEDFPFNGNSDKHDINFGTEGTKAFDDVVKYFQTIDFDFYDTTAEGY